MKCLAAESANSILYRSFFTLISKDSANLPQNNQEFYMSTSKAWKFVHIDSLSTFLTLFDTHNHISL